MLIKKEILLYEEEKYFSFFYMCVVHLGMCVFKCVCVCRPDIDVGSLPDHCLLYLLRQGLPLNAESLDSASLAKLDCLASVSHKQGLQGGFLLRFQGSRCSPHTCSKDCIPSPPGRTVSTLQKVKGLIL